MSIFNTKLGRRGHDGSVLDQTVEHIQNALNNSHLGGSSLTKAALSTESLREDEVQMLLGATDTLSTALESIASRLNISGKLSSAQIEAGTAAGILSGDVQAYMATPAVKSAVSTESMAVVGYNNMVADGFDKRAFSMEAYDERENRNAMVYSIAYNMQAARQDEFGETFFPTVVVSPDNVGLGVSVRLFMVFNDLQRNVSGALDQYNKKNIIRALADPTILKNEMTRIVPVHRAQSADKFVDAAVIAPRTISLEGEAITTSALATGKKVSLLGISQTDTLLNSGVMDVTDSIDPSATLSTLYVKAGNDVLSFDVRNLPFANFTYTTQNNYRMMTLAFDTKSVMLNKNTKRVDGSALDTLAPVVTGDLIVRLAINASGSINIETAETVVYGNGVGVHSVQNSSGEQLDLSTGAGKDIVDLFANASIIGYELVSYRTNMNRRQRGQLLDISYFTQLYNVPLRSPITALRPVNAYENKDTSDLSGLITATHIRTSNAAVGSLIQAANMLHDYIDSRDVTGEGPDVLGVGRFLVRPTFFSATVDMATAIDSIKAHERAADIQAVLVNKIRDLAYRMYRDSEYKAAADAMAGGIAPTPTVIIGTDPVLARYLTVTGDLRTLGGEFDVRIVSTLDHRVSGKIFVTLGSFGGNTEAGPNPLHFGCMAWKPELVLTLPISRNNQVSKELTVQPSFLHIVNLPVMSVLEVLNVPDVLSKVPVYMKTL